MVRICGYGLATNKRNFMQTDLTEVKIFQKDLRGYFLPRDAVHKRGYSRHAVSVRPSVRLSASPSVCHVRGSCQNE